MIPFKKNVTSLKKTIKKNNGLLNHKNKKKSINKDNLINKNKELNQKIMRLEEQLSEYKIKRGKFIVLTHRPKSILSALETVEKITKNNNIHKLEDEQNGATPIIVGERKVGSMMDCPLRFDWWFVGVLDGYILQFGRNLMNGKLKIFGGGGGGGEII